MSFSSTDRWIEQATGRPDYEGLMRYQMEKVNDVINYVKKHTRFYREKLRGIELPLRNISALPFTEASDIREHYQAMLCVNQGEISRVVTNLTSGTTAPSKRIFFTESDLEATIDFFHHGMMEFTQPGDKVLILFPCEKHGSIGQLLGEGIVRMGAEPIFYGLVSDFDDLLRLMTGLKINVIVGLPRQVLELARLFPKNTCIHTPHSVLLSADYVADSLVMAVEKNLDCTVYEHFGMTETCYGGGVYSRLRDGYHLRHNDFLFEIVDFISSNPMPIGEYGEIVFTSFNMKAMPLIRYRTGDVSRFLPSTYRYPVLEKIKGRVSGFINLPDGNCLSMSELDEALFSNDNVLDFSASFSEEMLTVCVRVTSFDAEKITDTIRSSAVGKKLKGYKLRVLPEYNTHMEKNTMTKRIIKQ